MIFWQCILLLLVTLFLNRWIKGRYLCASSLYASVWYVFLAISSLGLYGLYIPSGRTYKIAIVSCITFSVVSLFFGKITMELKEKRFVIQNKVIYSIKYNFLYFLHLVAYAFSFPFVIKSVRMISRYGFAYLRGVDRAEIGQSTYTVLAFQWILLPLFTVTMCLAGIEFAEKRKFTKVVWLSIIDTVVYSVTYGGRYIVAKLLFYFVMGVLLNSTDSIKNFIKKQKKVILFGGVLIAVLVYMTSLRSLSGFNFMGNVVGYYTGSIIFLSKILDFQNPPLYYGKMTFGFFVNFFKSVMKVIFSLDYTGTDADLQSIIANADYLKIGDNTWYNALPSWLYTFIIDFGLNYYWIGVLIIAIFINIIEKKYYKKKNMVMKVLYMFMLYNCFDSILRDNLIYPGAFVTCVLPFFLIRKSVHKREEEL